VPQRTLFAIHGAFAGPWCFAPLAELAERRGWSLQAVALQADLGDGRPAGLRDYLAQCLTALQRLPEPPVIVGHSMGGLLAQQLATLGAARAAILLAPAPPWGVFYGTWRENANLVAGLWHLGPFWTRLLSPDRRVARDYSMQGMEPAARADALARLRPESGRILFEINCWAWDATRASDVAAHRLSCPMLCVAGGADQVISPATVQAIARRFGDLALVREYPDLGHFMFGEPAQAEMLEDCLDWLDILDVRVAA